MLSLFICLVDEYYERDMKEEIYNRGQLLSERHELEKRVQSEFSSPKDHRRIDQINSLLMTNGERDHVEFVVSKGSRSNRVTSFTKDRR